MRTSSAGLLLRLRETGVHSGAAGCHGRPRGGPQHDQGATNCTCNAPRTYCRLADPSSACGCSIQMHLAVYTCVPVHRMHFSIMFDSSVLAELTSVDKADLPQPVWVGPTSVGGANQCGWGHYCKPVCVGPTTAS